MMPTRFRSLLVRDDAVTSIEYALIASLLAIVIIFAITAAGNSLQSTYEGIASAMGN